MKNKDLIKEFVRKKQKRLSERNTDTVKTNPSLSQLSQMRAKPAPIPPGVPANMRGKPSQKPMSPRPAYKGPVPLGAPKPPQAPQSLSAPSFKPSTTTKPSVDKFNIPKDKLGQTPTSLGGPKTFTKGPSRTLPVTQKDIDNTIKNIDPMDLPDATKYAKLVQPPPLSLPDATKDAHLMDPDKEKIPNATRFAKMLSPGEIPDATKDAKFLPSKGKMPSLSSLAARR
jgi:hypothetical protein